MRGVNEKLMVFCVGIRVLFRSAQKNDYEFIDKRINQ